MSNLDSDRPGSGPAEGDGRSINGVLHFYRSGKWVPIAPDWRLPYRTMDAGGSPDTAGAVGRAWIEGLGLSLAANCAGEGLRIETFMAGGDTGVICLYRRTHLLATATIFRDVMNFAVLVRWRLPEEFDCDRCNMAEPSRIGCLGHDCPYRIGRYNHEGWPHG